MSLNQDASRVSGQPHTSKTLDKPITSNNVCSVNRSDSDSEASAGWHKNSGIDAATLARFWAKVNRFGPVPAQCPDLGNCWLWTANTVRGYGQFVLARTAYGQRHVYAHRFAYELIHGALPSPSIKACHRCDTPLCVRPSHMFAGSQANNLLDARRKGRLVDGAHRIRISDAAIADIRANYRPRHNGKALAAKYGIALTSLLRVVAGTARRPSPSNVERVPTVELPIYELRDLLQAPRQFRQPSQSVGVHAQQCAIAHQPSSMTLKVTHKGSQSW